MPRVPGQQLHVRLLKEGRTDPDDCLEDRNDLEQHRLRKGLPFTGSVYVVSPRTSQPPWAAFVEAGLEDDLGSLTNRSNAAVLLLKRKKRTFGLTFGHGRHLLRLDAVVQDFGLKVALNAVEPSSLQSVDSFTVEGQTVHTRAQASRASGIQTFGIDVSRDILRAVTGTPRDGLRLRRITGGDAGIAITVARDFEQLGDVCDELIALYASKRYLEHFDWVDHISRVKDPSLLAMLETRLLETLRGNASDSIVLAPPSPVDWAVIDHFRYPNWREDDEELSLARYLDANDPAELTVDRLKQHTIKVYGPSSATPQDHWSVYDSLVTEMTTSGGTFVLAAGDWFAIEPAFAKRVQAEAKRIRRATLPLPAVKRSAGGRFEDEPSYNKRAAMHLGNAVLLDAKLGKCLSASSGIELCDVLTKNGELVHVKHRKGGSSSLSHHFAQARIAAEAFRSDPTFRMSLHKHLGGAAAPFKRLLPSADPEPREYTVVLAILGSTDPQSPAADLPFFSQLNLVRTHQSLQALGFAVRIQGIPVAP